MLLGIVCITTGCSLAPEYTRKKRCTKFVDMPCFGYVPTCWQLWPEHCLPCPPPVDPQIIEDGPIVVGEPGTGPIPAPPPATDPAQPPMDGVPEQLQPMGDVPNPAIGDVPAQPPLGDVPMPNPAIGDVPAQPPLGDVPMLPPAPQEPPVPEQVPPPAAPQPSGSIDAIPPIDRGQGQLNRVPRMEPVAYKLLPPLPEQNVQQERKVVDDLALPESKRWSNVAPILPSIGDVPAQPPLGDDAPMLPPAPSGPAGARAGCSAPVGID